MGKLKGFQWINSNLKLDNYNNCGNCLQFFVIFAPLPFILCLFSPEYNIRFILENTQSLLEAADRKGMQF